MKKTAIPALGLAEASEVIGRFQQALPPRILHQYWDKNPPRQIRKLLKHGSKLCAASGLEHRIWTEETARALLADGFADVVLQAYETAPHPAMKSDVLRLAALLRFGGVYLDADMALRTGRGNELWTSFTGALVFKWNLEERLNAPNWCIGFQPNHPMLAFCLDQTAQQMLTACRKDPEWALRNALRFGPGAFTEAVGSWIAAHGSDGVTVLDVQDAYKMVQNGPQFLNAPLAYKKTAVHWLVASRG